MGNIKTVLKWAVLSRLLLLAVSYVFSAFPDFDTSQENLLNRAVSLPLFVYSLSFFPLFLSCFYFFILFYHRKRGDAIVERLLGHFARWDGVYFAMIAKEGYKYEQFNAFFPLYPFAVSWFSFGSFRLLFNIILFFHAFCVYVCNRS